MLPFGCFFAVGILIWSQSCVKMRPAHAAYLGIFVLSCLISLVASGRYRVITEGGDSGDMVIPALIWLASLFLMWASIRWAERLERPLQGHASAVRTIGLITYPLYLLHNEIGRVIMPLLAGLGPLGALALTTVLLLGLSWLVVLIEPLIRTFIRTAIQSRTLRPSAAVK